MKTIRFTSPRAVVTALSLFAFVAMGCDQQTSISETAGEPAPVHIYDTTEELSTAVEARAVPQYTLDDSFREFQTSIDWKRLMDGMTANRKNGNRDVEIRSVLTREELAAVQRFYITTLAWNKDAFAAEYGGSFARLLAEHPDALSCTKFKNPDNIAKLRTPCDKECGALLVAMGGMLLSTGSIVGATFGIAGVIFAGDAVADCFNENNVDSCW